MIIFKEKIILSGKCDIFPNFDTFPIIWNKSYKVTYFAIWNSSSFMASIIESLWSFNSKTETSNIYHYSFNQWTEVLGPKNQAWMYGVTIIHVSSWSLIGIIMKPTSNSFLTTSNSLASFSASCRFSAAVSTFWLGSWFHQL